MKKKIIISILCVLIVIGIVSFGVVYKQKNINSVAVVKKNVQNVVSTTKTIDIAKSKVNDSNSINGLDLGVLSKDDFDKAIEIGKQYKGKEINIENKNRFVSSYSQFKETWAKGFQITTPFKNVIEVSKSITEKYIESNEENVCNELKKDTDKLNEISCVASVGGDTIDFARQLHIVLKVYGDEEKVLQPKEIMRVDKSRPTDYFPKSPIYNDGIGGTFDAKDIEKLHPKQLEIIVIYPDDREVKQKFEYSKLNEL